MTLEPYALNVNERSGAWTPSATNTPWHRRMFGLLAAVLAVVVLAAGCKPLPTGTSDSATTTTAPTSTADCHQAAAIIEDAQAATDAFTAAARAADTVAEAAADIALYDAEHPEHAALNDSYEAAVDAARAAGDRAYTAYATSAFAAFMDDALPATYDAARAADDALDAAFDALDAYDAEYADPAARGSVYHDGRHLLMVAAYDADEARGAAVRAVRDVAVDAARAARDDAARATSLALDALVAHDDGIADAVPALNNNALNAALETYTAARDAARDAYAAADAAYEAAGDAYLAAADAVGGYHGDGYTPDYAASHAAYDAARDAAFDAVRDAFDAADAAYAAARDAYAAFDAVDAILDAFDAVDAAHDAVRDAFDAADAAFDAVRDAFHDPSYINPFDGAQDAPYIPARDAARDAYRAADSAHAAAEVAARDGYFVVIAAVRDAYADAYYAALPAYEAAEANRDAAEATIDAYARGCGYRFEGTSFGYRFTPVAAAPSPVTLAERVAAIEKTKPLYLVEIANAIRLTDLGKKVFYSIDIVFNGGTPTNPSPCGYFPCYSHSLGTIGGTIGMSGFGIGQGHNKNIGTLHHEFLHAVYHLGLYHSEDLDYINEQLRQLHAQSSYMQYLIGNYVRFGNIPASLPPDNYSFLTELFANGGAIEFEDGLEILVRDFPDLDRYYSRYF